MTSTRLLACALAGLSLLAPGLAPAQSLAELYQAAREFDASYQSVRSQAEATQARAEQARAGLRPTVTATAAATRSSLDSTVRIPSSAFGTISGTLSASHPLYRPQNRIALDQALKSAEAGQIALQAAEQDLLVRVSQAYFDVLAAQDALVFVGANKAAVSEQLAAARRNFEVGTATITDTREAQARFDLVTAQQIAAENDLRVKKLALDALVGRADTAPRPLALPATLPALLPNDVGAWLAQAMDEHPTLRQSAATLEVARLEAARAQAAHQPTVDLTASLNRAYNDGSAASRVETNTRTVTIGVSLNLPLYSGGALQNRVREALALEDKARADLEAARRTVSQGVRAAFFGVSSGLGQVRALEAAEVSSQSALDANKLGYQVGVRINIDVLNAQTQLFQTKRDLARARYDVLLGGLRLRQASGLLKPEDLQGINAMLQK